MGGIEGSNPNAKFLAFILIAIFHLCCISPILIVIIDLIHYYKNDNLFNQINFYNNIKDIDYICFLFLFHIQ